MASDKHKELYDSRPKVVGLGTDRKVTLGHLKYLHDNLSIRPIE